ncbi:MAG: hypothetical protein ABEI99_04765, partial [Halobaculum sp.]
ERFVRESTLNDEIPEGTGRRLTVRLRSMTLLSGDGSVVRQYDIGGTPEPLYTAGVSGAGSHDGETWRWFTAAPGMQSVLNLPESVAESTQIIRLELLAADDGFRFTLTLGDADPVSATADRRWTTVRVDLSDETATRSPTRTETATPTETVSPTETAGQTETATRSETAVPADVETTHTSVAEQSVSPMSSGTTEAEAPGFGAAAALGGLAAGVVKLVRDRTDGG